MPIAKSNSRIQILNFKLQSILELTQAINNNASQKILLNQFAMILRYYLDISKILIFHHRNNWNVILRSGIRLNMVKQIDFVNDILPLGEKITQVSMSKKVHMRAFDFVIPIYHKKKPLAYVLIGDVVEASGVSPSIKHLMFIQTLANILMVAIENKYLYKENLEQEAMRRDLALASEVQSYLIPNNDKLPNNQYFTVEGYYQPHFNIGGDYYDFIRLAENEYLFCVADVSGKGVSAALLMSNFQANLRALSRKRIGLKTLVTRLNDLVYELTNNDRYVTMFVAHYDTDSRLLKYVNAGHNFPFFYDAATNTISYLKKGTAGIGMLQKLPPVVEGRLKITPRSILLAYTDGLVELNDQNNVEVNMADIEKMIRQEKKLKPILKHIRYRVEKSTKQSSYFDDISVLGIEFH